MEPTTSCSSEQKVKKPVGQAALATGFKIVTKDELYQRFACKQIEDKVNRGIRIEFEAKVEEMRRSDQYKILAISQYSRTPWYYVEYRKKGILGFLDAWLDSWKTLKSKRLSTCDVAYIPLDEYVSDTIPERCLETVEKARKLGLKDFYVAYPQITVKEYKDPVIIARLGKADFEIDMYE